MNASFRTWIYNLYLDNRDERLVSNEELLSDREYFNRFKYRLKREYRRQQRKLNK